MIVSTDYLHVWILLLELFQKGLVDFLLDFWIWHLFNVADCNKGFPYGYKVFGFLYLFPIRIELPFLFLLLAVVFPESFSKNLLVGLFWWNINPCFVNSAFYDVLLLVAIFWVTDIMFSAGLIKLLTLSSA